MAPLDKGTSLSPYVAKILNIIGKSGLDYELHAMGTLLEGPWDEVMATMKQCHQLLEQESERISTTIKIDYRRDATDRIAGKVKSVEQRLGRQLQSKRSK